MFTKAKPVRIDGRFHYENWEVFNVIQVTSSEKTEFSNFEIYGFKYFAVFVTEGNIDLQGTSVTKILNPIEISPVLTTVMTTL